MQIWTEIQLHLLEFDKFKEKSGNCAVTSILNGLSYIVSITGIF